MSRPRTFPAYIPYPPEPNNQPVEAVVAPLVYQTPTPPPSPSHRGPPQRSPRSDSLYWGLMKPLNAIAPFKNWFMSSRKVVYTIGNSAGAEFCAPDVPSMRAQQCRIMWDGSDNFDAATIIDYSPPPYSSHFISGTFINGERMKYAVPYVLRHGDQLRIYPSAVMGAHEDLNFVWLQCTRRGWLPLRYEQYPGPFEPDRSSWW